MDQLKSKRLWLIGGSGQLGSAFKESLEKVYSAQPENFSCTSSSEVDVRSKKSVRNHFAKFKPEIVLNCSGFADVEAAESRPELAFQMNHMAVEILAEEIKKIGAKLIHFSSDYVFDGKKGEPYVEDDTPNPLNVYGRSKLAGERSALGLLPQSAYVFRTTWIFGPKGRNFFNQILSLSLEESEILAVQDQIGVFNSVRTIVHGVLEILEAGSEKIPYGLYHLSAERPASRLEFAERILEWHPHPELKKCKGITAVPLASFQLKSKRPLYCILSSQKIKRLGISFRNWDRELRDYLQQPELVSKQGIPKK